PSRSATRRKPVRATSRTTSASSTTSDRRSAACRDASRSWPCTRGALRGPSRDGPFPFSGPRKSGLTRCGRFRIDGPAPRGILGRMLAFILRRFGQAALVMLVVGICAFALFQYVGDPINNMVGQDATPAQRERLRTELGLDRSAPVQFASFVRRAVQGD